MLEDIRSIVGKYLDKDLVGAVSTALAGIAPIRLAVYDLDCKPVTALAGSVVPIAELASTFSATMGVRTCDAGAGRSVLWAPLLVEDELVGFLAGVLDTPATDGRWLKDLKAVVLSHADLVGRLIQARRAIADLTMELSHRYEDLNLANHLGDMLRISERDEDRLARQATLFSETLELDLVAIVVPSMGIELVHPPARAASSNWRDSAMALALLTKAAGGTTALVVNDIGGMTKEAGNFAHAMVAALDVDGSEGFIAVMRQSPEARFFTTESKMLDLVARQVSIALTNSRILEARVAVFDTAVFALARLAESRDPETGKHLERVQNYARVLARRLAATAKYRTQIDRDYIEDIYRSSPLHDIGKVGIQDAILLKPGQFAPEEFAIMKTHAAIGGDTLRDAETKLGRTDHTFLTMGRQIAYGHHEKWNGTGYPAGLAGDAIPLSARIVALADVYDAITSKRCYKDASSHEKTREILAKDSGTHFDPDVIEAFIASEGEFLDIAARLSEQSEDKTA